jgi:hypothetical protein
VGKTRESRVVKHHLGSLFVRLCSSFIYFFNQVNLIVEIVSGHNLTEGSLLFRHNIVKLSIKRLAVLLRYLSIQEIHPM